MELPSNWYDKVESIIINKYKHFSLKGDIDNSVLAGFLLYDSQENVLSVISLATGTKSMSGDQRMKSSQNGPIFVHDCHAEVLAHRALQQFFWEQYDAQNKQEKSIFIENKLLSKYSIHFYTSTPPCGDCCIHIISDKITVETGAKPFTCDQSQLSTSPPNVVRGKPGRGSKSQSVSCSDKICIWANVGIVGSFLSQFIDQIHLSSIIIGNGNYDSCVRSIFSRVQSKLDINCPIICKISQWKQKNDNPSSSSFFWWSSNLHNGEQIAPKYGRKFGVIEKKQYEKRFFSSICDAIFFDIFKDHMKQKLNSLNDKTDIIKINIDELSFGESKELCKEYQSQKKIIKEKLLLYGEPWAQKFTDEKKWKSIQFS